MEAAWKAYLSGRVGFSGNTKPVRFIANKTEQPLKKNWIKKIYAYAENTRSFSATVQCQLYLNLCMLKKHTQYANLFL